MPAIMIDRRKLTGSVLIECNLAEIGRWQLVDWGGGAGEIRRRSVRATLDAVVNLVAFAQVGR